MAEPHRTAAPLDMWRADEALSSSSSSLCGRSVDALPTPALVVDLDVFERNQRTLRALVDAHNERRRAADADATPVVVRPHAKAHKSPAVAAVQCTRFGCVGVCVSKVSEAAALVDGGVDSVHVSNEIVDERKLRTLAHLSTRARFVSVCIDQRENIAQLRRACEAVAANTTDASSASSSSSASPLLHVVVEVECGQRRCGVAADDVAHTVALARAVVDDGGRYLRFAGLQAYHGMAQHIRRTDERRASIAAVAAVARAHRDAVRDAGIACDYVTGGGTGTFEMEMASSVFTEVQPGSYLFMDADYAANLADDGARDRRFEQSLFVVATVNSTTRRGAGDSGAWAIVDAGSKALSCDSGAPRVVRPRELASMRYSFAGDEHGQLRNADDAADAARNELPPTCVPGARLWLQPSHCDTTTNLYDVMFGVRDGTVECVWPIVARGPGV